MVFGYTKALATGQYLEVVVSNKTVLGVFLLGKKHGKLKIFK